MGLRQQNVEVELITMSRCNIIEFKLSILFGSYCTQKPSFHLINIIFIVMIRKQSGLLAHFLLFSFFLALAFSFTYTNFQLTDSNQGVTSHYLFAFTPALSHNFVELVITFPIEYSLSAFAGTLECFSSQTGLRLDYSPNECWVQPDSTANTLYLLGSVVVDLPFVNSTNANYVLLKNVKNPTTNLSSYFQVCLRKNGVRIQCQKYFSKSVFSPPAIVSPIGVSIIPFPNPAYIGRGTTYTFNLKISASSLAYANENLLIRVKMDTDFSSDGPICSLGDYNSLGYNNQYIPVNTMILPATLNEVDCGPITNLGSLVGLNNELTLKIDNMINPLSFKTYLNTKVQIIRQIHMQPIETVTFPVSPIQIAPENIEVSIRQSNYMRMSTNTYYFMLNHYTELNESSSITIEFLSNTWTIYEGFALFGFTSASTLKYEITGNKIKFYNYGNASYRVQQILGVNLTSYDFAGTYPVKLTTQLFNQTLGQWYGNVFLNETIGTFNLLSVSAVQAATKLPVDSTGPLQMTFFLNYELPPSDDVPNGTLEITIFPQIPEPDPEINGVVKCYWKGTLQAADCTYDNSFPNKTIITLVSPPHDAFKYSQIPVIITTEGGQTPDDLGLTIDPLVQRYRFECEFHLYNSSSIPSQVFYTTWIADAIQLTTTTVRATTHECSEYTHLQINMTTPLLDSSLPKQFRIMVQFLNADGSGWANSVGYQIDKIYQRYPCVVIGLVGTNIHCDLYTFYQRETPYSNLHINNDFTGPYILIYGFNQNVPTGIPVRIQIPKIKVGSTPGAQAHLGISILEETPGEKQPYVELYFQDLVAFVTKNPISIPQTSVPSSQPSPIEIQTSNQYHVQWSPILPASVKYIMYEMTPEALPSLIDKDAVCTTNQCVGLGLPANWIVETPASVGAPHVMDTLLNYVRAMDYLPQTESFLPIRMVTYDGNGNTVDKYKMDIHYIAKPIPTCSFDFLETTVYSGLQQWYSISFANTNSTLSNYPFLRFTLANGLSFTDPPQCNSSTILPFNESGLICVRENAQTMRVHNIKSLAALGTYNIWFRMETTLTSHTSQIRPIVDIHINHNNSVDSSIVSLKEDLQLTQAPVLPLLSAPQKFEIHNPQIVNEDIQIGYIGPLYLQFMSQASGVFDINVEFSSHLYNGGYWRTPTSSNLDPVVCWLNEVRYDCTPNNQANKVLKINTVQTSVVSGLNELRFETEYIDPFNGIKFPDVPGMYSIKLTLANSTSSASVNLYAEIQPPKFLHMQAGSIVKDVDTETVYKINFTLPTYHIYPNSYFDAANRSRIVVQFPTMMGNQPVFTSNLGLYQGKFQERVGCYFKTGGQYVTFAPTFTLQCRLIPSKKLGDPVKVQIINHAAFSAAQNSLSVYIFKVLNPIQSHSSVPVTVKIDHIDVVTGFIYPLYKQTYRIFLDPRPKNGAPITYPSVDDPSVQFFEATKDVGDYGSIFMNAHTVSGNPVTQPYYMLVKLPEYLDPQDNQIAPAFSSCPSSAFEECVSVPEINYLMVKVILNQSQFQAVMKDYPISISLVDSFFYSNIIENGRFTGIIEYIISARFRWQEIQGTLVLNYCQASGLQSKLVKNKDHFEIAISFTVTNFIPEQGSIEIGFPSSITNVKPHCRSSAELGSGLKTRSGNSGEIGCMVQNTNKWVITGFADVPAGTTIIIRGQVDLPSISGTIGVGHITTYADTNLIDIHANGSRIDHLEKDFNMILIDSFAMNANEEVFMTQRSVIRAGFVGEFRMLLKSALPIASTDTVTFRMATNDIRGTPGGFYQNSRPKVCQFIRIDTNEQIGCKVTNQINDISILGQQSIVYVLQPTETLLSAVTYQIRLTTQAYSEPALLEGIPYPSSPGTYKIQTITTISGVSKTEHRYIEIYGTSFTQLKVTQYNYLAGEYNLIWVQFVPTTMITTDHQIVLEFPTLSSNGTTMFDNNLGLNDYKDGDEVPVDIFDSPPLNNNYMKCRIYFGDFTRAMPAKVVCGFLASNLLAPTYLRFAFGFVNPPRITAPSIPSQISLPLIVYSYDPFYFEKTNFNLVNAAVLVYNGQDILAPNGYFATLSNQLQMPNDNLIFGDAHTFPLLVGDSYVMRFNFPLRVNDKYPGLCKSTNGVAATGVYGDAYYHEKLRIVVCKVTTTIVPAQIAPLSPTMMLSGFYTPWYRLADSERIVHAIATYHSTSTSEVVNYFDLFPHLVPRWQFTNPSLLQLEGHLKHNVACQSDDYVFTVQLESPSSTFLDLQYCKMISIHLPLTTIIDYYTLNTDCVEYPGSQIHVTRCNIDLSARAIFVEIVPGIYNNGMTIAVKTKDHAIRNPCFFWSAFNILEFTVFFYSWENITYADTRSPDYAYMVMDRRNLSPFPLAYSLQEYPTGLFSYYYTFDWIHTPHERTYNEFPQYTLNQYSPFSFDIWLMADVPAAPVGLFHKISLKYGLNYVTRNSQWALDLNYDKTVCYLDNNRVQRCTLDTVNKVIYMEFSFGIFSGKPIHVYFSILDPRQPHFNGFRYNGTSDIDKVRVDFTFSDGTNLVFETEPFMAKQTHVGGTGATLPQRGIHFATIDWATSMVGKLNVLDMTFYVNRSDITGLQFIIPLRNEINQLIYSANSRSAFFNIEDGGEYPCGNNNPGVTGTGYPKCFIYNGDNTEMGFPTIITMVDFQYSGSVIKARLLLSNPDVNMKWFTIKVRAFSGTPDSQTLFGHQYVGYWYFVNVFRTVPGTYSSIGFTNWAGSSYLSPNKGNWREQTTWSLQGTSAGGLAMAALGLGLGGYAIVEVPLRNYLSGYVDDEFCESNFIIGSSSSSDMLILKSKESQYSKAYFIKKWSASPWSIQFFKCKHYGNGLISYEYPTQIVMEQKIHNYNILNSYFPAVASMASITYFQVIQGRALVEFDITSMMSTLIAEKFIWDDQIDYELNVDLIFYSFVTWSAVPSACYVTGGFLNTKGTVPNCFMRSSTAITVRGFQQILNKRSGAYVIKLELDIADLSNSPNSLGANIVLYANSDTNLARQFIYSTSTVNTYSRTISVLSQLTFGRYCGVSYSYTNNLYNTYTPNNMNVDILDFGLGSTAVLNVKLKINTLSTFSMVWAGYNSYPWFRFYIEGYDYVCNGINRMDLTYINSAGTRSTYSAAGWAGTRCSGNFFEVEFYASGVSITGSGWNGLSTFDLNEFIEVDAQFAITAAEKPELRDWIGVRTFINTFYYDYCCQLYDSWGWWICSAYYCYTYYEGYSQQAHSPIRLADSLTLDSLTKNVGYPTEFIFTMIQVYPEIGRNNVDKLLLLEFNTGTHPFNYINSTSGNHLIECRCITSWAATFNPSSTVIPECYLRIPQAPFIRFAITIDIDVAPNQNLQCYFPGWTTTSAFTYTATAKLINEGSSFAPWINDNRFYGGFYWIDAQNSVPFTNLPLPQPITLSESPTIYSVDRYVNLFHTSSYVLTLNIGGFSILDPIVYIDFQKSGFIPDQSFCSSAAVFAYCRVYNTLRNIIVAKFSTAVSTSTVQFTKGSVNLQYPKHKEPGTNYDILAYMRSSATDQYTFSGNLARSDTRLLPTLVQFYCEPEKTSSTNLESYRTNLVLSFKMGGHTLFSTPKQGAKVVITENVGLLALSRGCTAVPVDDPTFLLDCQIKSSQIIVTNPSYTSTLSVSGLIQVVVGIVNPTVPVTWTIKSYEYWFNAANYGQQIESTVVYTPKVETGAEQRRSQIRMLPFNTKVYSTVHTPFRIAFKISNSPPSLPDDIDYDLGHKMIFKGFDALPSFTNFQCLFKEYTLEPTEKPQTPLLNPYRNWKQNTQYIPLYAYCNKIGTDLEIEAPRTKPLSINNYYELVIMPTGIGLTQTGFSNGFDSEFRLITYPNSCEYIGQWMFYSGHMFALNSMYLVTYRPLVDTALQLHFELLFSSGLVYPSHYLQVHFQDINFNAIKAPYNQKGIKIPCTLSSQFVTAGRQNGPRCVVNHVHEPHGDLVIRVTQIGALPLSNSYKLSLDDFLLPDLSTLLEQSNPFSVCLRYHKQAAVDVHHERCFEELFVIDGVINTIPVINNVGTFHNPPQNQYAAAVTGKLEFNYPMTSTSTVDQKSLARIKGGYSATSPSPLSFGSHSLLWFNPELNLYILRQPSVASGTPTNITMNGLINPEPYQKQQYSFINTVEMTYYNAYHPNNYYLYNQPPYSYFVLYSSLVQLMLGYQSDIRTQIPTDSQSIVKMRIQITDTVPELTRKLNNVFEITFNSADISEVEECWVESVISPMPYSKNGWCQTTTDGRILLYNFYKANVNANLIIFVRLRHVSTNIRIVSKLYSDNGQIQYNDTYTRTQSKISTAVNHLLVSFTENYYTPYYYEQSIIPLTKSTTCKYMHFSLNLPQDMIHALTIFTVYLPAPIIPSNLLEVKQKCEWLLVDRYNRQFHTGVYSHCIYSAGKIVVTAPYGGLLALSGGNQNKYLLRIREMDVINTVYSMPPTSKPEEILFGFNDTNIFKYDTLLIYPYEHFSSLAPFMYTLNVGQLNTYHVEFIPAVSVAPGFQAVLELSIDTRYLVKDLGMESLFNSEGIDYNNQTRIDNLNYNAKFDMLFNKWRNGAPYTCYTSTRSLANQTTVHTGNGNNNKRTRITHLLETAYVGATKYIWKVPLLLNPTTLNLPFRMNLTLWTYQATGIGLGQKELFYEIVNHRFTQPNNPASFAYTIPATNPIQVTTANISVKLNSVGDAPALGQYAELKFNNKLTGIIDIDNLELYTEPDTSYTFYFFPRVNLLMAHKRVTDFATHINLGALEISNEYVDYYGYEWIKVHSAASSTTVRKSGPVSKLLTNCVINPITLYATTEGISSIKDSQFLVTITFVNSNCWIPRNSTMVITYPSTVLQSLTNSDCYITFREYTCIHSSGRIEITYYDQIPMGRTITIRVYFRAKSIGSAALSGYIYGIPGSEFTRVIDFPSIGITTVSTDNIVDSPLFEHIQTNYIYEDSQIDIRGTVITNKPLVYFDITHPFTSSLASQQRMIMRKNSTSPYLFDYRTELNWLQNQQSVISNSEAIYTVPPNGLLTYNVLPAQEHTFILESTYDVSGSFNNFTVGPVGSYYLFQYLTNNQIAYDEVYPIPVAEHLTIINPFTQISQETAIGLRFSVTNFTIVPGNRITIELDTHNLRYDMFRETSKYSIECVERVKGIITWQPILVCEVTQQPTLAFPNRALIITVYPKLSVPAGTVMEIWLSPVFNPSIVMVAGAIVRVDRNCNGEQRCVIYESRGYYRTTTGMNMNQNLTGIFTPSQTEVLLTNVDHTFTLLPDTYTAAFFRYPENYDTVMPLSCVESGGNTCLIFPGQKRVLTLLPNVSTSSITLQGMSNGIYLQPLSQFIDVLALTPSSSNLYHIPHNNLTTRRQIPATGSPTWMTISPTQTPGIFLRNYMNTATINIYGLYSTTFVNCFYINAPKQIITWDTKYCNATFESLNHDPYPTRLMCSFINDTTLQILIPEGVEENYLPNITQEFIMTVHAKFFIEDFAPGDGILYVTPPVVSGTFNAYGSYSVPNHAYPFYITEASDTIVISEHRVPIIGRADFNTESYAERLANVNEQTTFQLLIDPKTTETVKRIELVIPEEFGYPPVGVHDSCDLITTDTTHIANCYEIRRNNQTIVSLELVDYYDNRPRILKIGSQNISDWFKAPALPGSWYNMTVLLYSENGTLLEAQTTKNCSEIGGLDLSMPGIVITNGRDENKNEIVDISFTVGNLSIRQGYPDGLSNGQFYTEIRLIFQNLKAFDRYLGLNRLQGELTGCTTRNIIFRRQISCALDVGLNINDEPYILVQGYEPIMPGTNVTISLANILNLPSTQRSTVSVAVMLKKVGDNKIAFLYNPTKKVLMSTSAVSTSQPSQLSLSYSSPRVINSPTTISLTITPTMNINSYFVLKFPDDGINDEYQLFSPSCTLASRVEVFYRSDVVRIYPSTPHPAGTSRTYVITGFPTPKYAIGPLPWNVTVQAYKDLKQVNTQVFTIQNFEMASCRLNFGFISGTSPYTHDSEVIYVFEFALNSSSSSSQNSLTIGIKFPDSYGDIRQSSMTCEMNSNSSCQFTRPNYLEITGTRQSGQLIHRLTLRGVKNPETLVNLFQISSYVGQNVEQKMCSGQAQVTLLASTIQNCYLQVGSQHLTKQMESVYHFGFTCPDVIRNNSVLYISMSPNYSFNNQATLRCWADSRDNLLTNTCTIKFINGTFYIQIQNVVINKNEKTVGINIILNNPTTTGVYSFSANMTSANYTYALTNLDNISIYDGIPSAMQSLELVNLPKESGVQSYYFLRVPTSAINSTLEFGFPPEFELPPSVEIQKFTSNSSSWASSLKYNDALQLSGTPLTSEVVTTNDLRQQINIQGTNTASGSSGSWTYFMIKSIRNPAYQSQEKFTLDSFYTFDDGKRLLTATAQTQLNYTLNPPSGDVLHLNISVGDNDVLYFTNYSLTYRINAPHQTNQTTLYIKPPLPDMNYGLLSLNCCLVINSSMPVPYSYCSSCQIVKDTFKFVISQNGLKIPADVDFKITLQKLYNPPNATDCTVFRHHELSYFELKILKNDLTVTHSGSPPASMMSPCRKYRALRADILPTFPSVLYAGMVHDFKVRLSQPTKMLRVSLNCSDPMVSFNPSILYFPNYDVIELAGSIIVSSIANNNSKAYINVTHIESGTFDFYRPNLPYPVQIVADHKEYVIVQEKKAESIGYDITVPITITMPSSVDMYLEISVDPKDPNLILNSTQILLPAFSSSGSFTFRYNGNKIPPTINMSFVLKSPFPLSHTLMPQVCYLYFQVSASHNTLPPVMSVSVLHDYKNNSEFVGRTVYHYNNTGYLLYDKLLPQIIDHKDDFVGSTSANVIVHTREEATVAYLVYQYGTHLTQSPKTPEDIRSNPKSIQVDSKKNASYIVNPYAWLNLTQLDQQTQYFIYMMAYNTLGNSKAITIHSFTTKALSNAATFKITTKNYIEVDEVKIVRALADILKIDPYRIKIVSSEKNLARNFTNRSFENQPYYDHQIVISPSTTKDDVPAMETVMSRLMQSQFGKQRLQELIPNWIGRFNMSELRLENRVKPVLRETPIAKKISYYNASFSVRYWERARIHAIIIEYPNSTQETLNYTQAPIKGEVVTNSESIRTKQISRGLDWYNNKATDYFTALCNKEGYASIFFDELNPGSKYVMYVTATSPEIYEPTIYSDGISKAQFYTLWNPNLRNKEKLVLNQLKELKPQMYEAIKQFYENEEKKKNRAKPK